MTLEQRGLFIQVVAMIYANRGAIDNDPAWIGRAANCSPRLARVIISQLVKSDSLQVQGSKITQKRCEHELNMKRTHLELSAKGGRKKAENSSIDIENKDLTSTDYDVSVSSSTATAIATATPYLNNHSTALAAADGAASAEKKFDGENLKQLNGQAVALAENWVIPDEWGMEIEKLGIFSRDDIVREGKKFYNYWKTADARPVAAWTKHWRNWFNIAEESKHGLRQQKQNHRKASH